MPDFDSVLVREKLSSSFPGMQYRRVCWHLSTIREPRFETSALVTDEDSAGVHRTEGQIVRSGKFHEIWGYSGSALFGVRTEIFQHWNLPVLVPNMEWAASIISAAASVRLSSSNLQAAVKESLLGP